MTQKSQNSNFLETNFKELSIQINLDGLSFCIFNPVLGCVESIYNFPMNFGYKTEEEVSREVQLVIQAEEDLRQDFSNIKVLHNTPLFALIPQALYGEKEQAIQYLKYSIDVRDVPPQAVEIDKILPIETINAYLPNRIVNQSLLTYYGRFDYQHFATALLKMFLKHYASHAYELMYIYAEVGSFYFVVFRGKKLYYFNRFSYETIEDFLYYILFSIEQLNINTEEVALYITGEVSPTALFYNKVRRYVKQIYLLKYHKEHFAKGMNEELIRGNFVLTQSF
ncbi:MAG: DUF3822 family protein [Capnocytophaga sp.]|jgi:hypothetical protein|uniref:DUF3822 family protein n=1 Tax=Capnocytophaga sp. TaxID=44737 RepID=UPI0028E53093|nr:DUF3822 family protein [uncultured Capnocytophaga sp.]